MEKMTPIQRLDYVLNYIATTPFEKGGISYDFIYKKVIPPVEDGHELNKILNKLVKDQYLDTLPGGHYIITFEGQFWNQKKGYGQKLIDDDTETIRLAMVESAQKANQRTLTFLTWIIALGTLAGALSPIIVEWSKRKILSESSQSQPPLPVSTSDMKNHKKVDSLPLR